MNRETLESQLVQHEGIRLKPYKCPAGRTTIGVGRNLDDRGISNDEAVYLLHNDIEEVLVDLNRIFPEYFLYQESIQLVLADMRFNLGHDGFLKFKKLIIATKKWDWKTMIQEMVDSQWYAQVGDRGKNLVKMVESIL